MAAVTGATPRQLTALRVVAIAVATLGIIVGGIGAYLCRNDLVQVTLWAAVVVLGIAGAIYLLTRGRRTVEPDHDRARDAEAGRSSRPGDRFG